MSYDNEPFAGFFLYIIFRSQSSVPRSRSLFSVLCSLFSVLRSPFILYP